jgi:hypothetical protein
MADLPMPTPQCETALKRVDESMRDDALQEAWVAHLEKRDPVAAIWAFVKREQRYAQTHLSLAKQ